jgi:hypothetical protein
MVEKSHLRPSTIAADQRLTIERTAGTGTGESKLGFEPVLSNVAWLPFIAVAYA